MAIANKPEPEYILDCIVADLANIKKANKSKSLTNYFTDVATVEAPDYSWQDTAMILQETDPVLLVFVLGEMSSGKGNFQERRPWLRVGVVGCVKQDRKVQWAMLRLWDDQQRVMLANPMRNHPQAGAAQNTYGIHTSEAPAMATTFIIQPPSKQAGVAIFMSEYDIQYRAPF